MRDEYITEIQITRAENGAFHLDIEWDDDGEQISEMQKFATLHDLIDSAKFNTAIVNAEIGVVQDAVNQAMDIYKADCAKAMIYLTEIVKEVS
jgi:hypothetical protein